jgi:hypothetical protein
MTEMSGRDNEQPHHANADADKDFGKENGAPTANG